MYPGDASPRLLRIGPAHLARSATLAHASGRVYVDARGLVPWY